MQKHRLYVLFLKNKEMDMQYLFDSIQNLLGAGKIELQMRLERASECSLKMALIIEWAADKLHTTSQKYAYMHKISRLIYNMEMAVS